MYESNDDTKPDDTQMTVPAGLTEALPDMIDDAIDHMESAYLQKQQEMTEFYKGDLPGITQEDLDDGRSDIVSRDVHDAVMAILPDAVRVFLGADHVVEFEPAGENDDEVAPQATDAIRYIFEKENDAYSLIYGSFKDALIRKYAVAHWYHQHLDKSFVKEYTLLNDELAALMDDERGQGNEVELQETTTLADGSIKAKVRHVRHVHRFIVDLVPPEELIVSRKARNARGEHLIGRRRNLPKQQLIAMGISEELVEDAAADKTLEDNELAQERTPDGNVSGSDNATEEMQEALYVESYLEWPDGEKMCLYKVCTLGDAYTIVACEEVDAVDMALFTPDPEPHTPIGESTAEKVADIQRLKTGVWRGIVDSLAEALVPRMEVVEGQTNIDDAMSTEVGGLIRVRAPNMVRPVSQPFVGQQAVPLLENIDDMREERVGAFRAADGLSAEAMQSSTKMAVAATISGSKAQKELLARTYAYTFLRPIFRGLLRLFVQHQDKPKTMRLRGKWVPVDPRSWNADMDMTVDVAQAMLTVEEKAQQLGGIAEKQEQILQQMGPINPICNLGHYTRTLRELVRLTGRKNVDAFFAELPTEPALLAQAMQQFAQFQPPSQPDPAMVLAQEQVRSLQADAKRKDAEMVRKRDFEARQHQDQQDLERDRLDQQRRIELLKLAAQYGINVERAEAQIVADITKHRETLASQERNSEAERLARMADADANREHQAGEADKDRQVDSQRHALDTAVQDEQHQRTTEAQSQIAKDKAATKPKKEE